MEVDNVFDVVGSVGDFCYGYYFFYFLNFGYFEVEFFVFDFEGNDLDFGYFNYFYILILDSVFIRLFIFEMRFLRLFFRDLILFIIVFNFFMIFWDCLIILEFWVDI